MAAIILLNFAVLMTILRLTFGEPNIIYYVSIL